MNEIKLDKNTAGQMIIQIYQALQNIAVTGEQNITVMAGIFQGLKDLSKYVGEIKEDGGEKPDDREG